MISVFSSIILIENYKMQSIVSNLKICDELMPGNATQRKFYIYNSIMSSRLQIATKDIKKQKLGVVFGYLLKNFPKLHAFLLKIKIFSFDCPICDQRQTNVIKKCKRCKYYICNDCVTNKDTICFICYRNNFQNSINISNI